MTGEDTDAIVNELMRSAAALPLPDIAARTISASIIRHQSGLYIEPRQFVMLPANDDGPGLHQSASPPTASLT